jgi:hypothetical protein
VIVELIEQMHVDERTGYRELCSRAGLDYSCFMRWRKRCNEGEPPVQRSGPSKVEPVDMKLLVKQVVVMNHHVYRTDGTGELYREHCDEISRRDLNAMVHEERERQKKERKERQYHIQWHVPRLVWAMDDTQYRPDKQYPAAQMHNVQDLGSRFKFGPLVSLNQAAGPDVAAHLAELIGRYGPPLFLKRDNGGNLNHHAVDELLESMIILPLNSPCYYPQYNGSMEHCQKDVKSLLSKHVRTPDAFLAIQAEMDIHELNHTRHADLKATSWDLLESGLDYARTFTRRKRREIYDIIQSKTLELIETKSYKADAAWRRSVREWLTEHRFITVSRNGKVLP